MKIALTFGPIWQGVNFDNSNQGNRSLDNNDIAFAASGVCLKAN